MNKRLRLLIIVALFWFAMYVYVPFQTPYLLAEGVTASLAGIIVGAYGSCQMLLRFPVGVMADVKGRHKGFILLGLLAAGTASLWRVLLPNGVGFLIANLFSGLAASMWISFMVLYCSYFPKEQMQKATGTIIAVNNMGMLLAFVAGTLFYDHTSMGFLCCLSVAAAALGALVALGIQEGEGTGHGLHPRQLLGICKDKWLLFFAVMALLQQGIQMSTCMSFTTEAVKQVGGSGWQIGLCSIIYMLCAVVSAYVAASPLLAKWGPKVWVPVILALTALYCVLVPNLDRVEWFYLVQLLPGLSTGILLSYCTSESLVNVPGEMRSTAMGCFQAIYAVGMTTFPLLVGSLTRNISMGAGFYALAVLAMLGCGASVVFYRRQKTLLRK